MAPTLVYTAGYCRRDPETLHRGAIALGATVLDIRLYASSRRPEWTGEALRELLGGYYRPCPAWGNKNYKTEGAPIVIQDYDAGLAQFQALSGPVILLCYCPVYSQCHRAFIAKMLAYLDYEVEPFLWDAYEDAEPSLF